MILLDIDYGVLFDESLKIGVPFNQMIFIDDKQKNVDAATDLGIYSIVYNRETIKDEIESIFENIKEIK